MDLRDRDHGQALVEFSLAIPIFLLLVFGLIDTGRFVYVNNAVAQAAREAARWGSVQSRSEDATSRATVADRAIGSLAAVPAPTVTVTCEESGLTGAGCQTGDFLVVNVVSQVQMLTPVIGQLVGPMTLSSTARVVIND